MAAWADNSPNTPGTAIPASAEGSLETPPQDGIRGAVSMRAALTRRAIWIAKVLLAGGLLAWLVQSGKLNVKELRRVGLSPALVPLFALIFFSLLLPAVRWWWLLRIQKLPATMWRIIELSWVGNFAALVLPGAAGGDLARAYLIVRGRDDARARALSTVLADRGIGLYVLALMGSVASLWIVLGGEASRTAWSIAICTVALLLAMSVMGLMLLADKPRRVLLKALPRAWRDAWDDSFELYRRDIGGLVGCGVLSLVSNAATFVAFGITGRMLGDPVAWTTTFVTGPVICLANCIPLTPGGIGVGETVSQELFAGLNSQSGAEMMLIMRVATALVSLPGILVLFDRNR